MFLKSAVAVLTLISISPVVGALDLASVGLIIDWKMRHLDDAKIVMCLLISDPLRALI